MSYTAKSKILEQMIVELRKKKIQIPPGILSDLHSARTLLTIQNTETSCEGNEPKIGEYLGNVEAYIISEADKNLPPEKVNQWLASLEIATCESCITPNGKEQPKDQARFVTGVPRDQKWIRVQPMQDLPVEKIEELATEKGLGFKREANGSVVVYGTPESVKEYIKKITKPNGQKPTNSSSA